MVEKIRVGVIGAGWWSTEYHIPGLQAEPAVELVAVCDHHAGRLAEAAEAYHLNKTYADYRDMLANEQLDAAVVVTPHATHYSIASDCLDHRLHLLIEKPMTLSAREARELVRRADDMQRIIVMGYTYHYYRYIQQARQAIAAGTLGSLQYVSSSFSSNVYQLLSNSGPFNEPPFSNYSVHGPSENYHRLDLLGGGQGHLQLTHSIGLMLFVTGLRARRVQAWMNRHGLPTDLVDALSIEFEGGALGIVGGTGNAGSNHRMAMAAYGSEGCFIFDSLARFATLRDRAGRDLPCDANAPAPYTYSVTRNFIQVIQGKAENLASGEIGWRAVEVLDAAYRSAQQDGQPFLVEELYR